LLNISAALVLPTLRPLVPQHGHLSAYDPSNAIIITDTRSNIVRINEIIERIDRAAVVATELIELRYAKAAEVANVVAQLERPDPNRSGATPQFTIVPDQRINGVLVHGDDLQRQRARTLIDSLDRPQAVDSNVRVVYLRYAQAEQVAQVLSGVLQNLARLSGSSGAAESSVQADVDTNAILITADKGTMDTLLVVVDSLDIRRAQVLVEAIIVEIEDTGDRSLGIQWMYRDDKRGFGSSTMGDGTLGGIGQGALQGLSGTQSERDAGLLRLAGGGWPGGPGCRRRPAPRAPARAARPRR
jgi:general secretion pathway protein D